MNPSVNVPSKNNISSHFEKRKHTLLQNYKNCFYLSLLFPTTAYYGLKSKSGDTNMYKSFGFYSIFLTPLTPATIAIGVIGAIANTAWGIYALPAAKIKDNQSSKQEIKSEKNKQPTTSTTTILSTCQSLPANQIPLLADVGNSNELADELETNAPNLVKNDGSLEKENLSRQAMKM